MVLYLIVPAGHWTNLFLFEPQVIAWICPCIVFLKSSGGHGTDLYLIVTAGHWTNLFLFEPQVIIALICPCIVSLKRSERYEKNLCVLDCHRRPLDKSVLVLHRRLLYGSVLGEGVLEREGVSSGERERNQYIENGISANSTLKMAPPDTKVQEEKKEKEEEEKEEEEEEKEEEKEKVLFLSELGYAAAH